MNKIAIMQREDIKHYFEGEQYIIDLDREFECSGEGSLIIFGFPFWSIPLKLEIAISKDGTLKFRKWEWDTAHTTNQYFHTHAISDSFSATPEQIDTVNGLFSGRITFEGLKIPIGATIQGVCPINKEREEQLIGKKIYTC